MSLLLRSVEATKWMPISMSFRVFFPNACVGFFCEILVLEEKNIHASSGNVLLERKSVLRGTLLLR